VTDNSPRPTEIQAFIDRWLPSGGAERANYQSFLNELCDVLSVPRPEPTVADDAHNAYVFEREVFFDNGDGSTSPGWIDLYKRGHFVLEAKQGTEKEEHQAKALTGAKPKKKRGTAIRGTKAWDDAMLAAKGRAEQYARALPITEGWPPFIITVDIGHSFEIYADFTMSGRQYLPFPDARSYRIPFRELGKPEYLERLHLIWNDPLALDPTRKSAKVTREIAAQLGVLAKSMEASGYSAERVASFLMRCIFTMFAEDVKLLPGASFNELLKSLRGNVGIFTDMVGSLWQSMAEGSFSPILKRKLLRFNGGLFETSEVLPVTDEQLELLITASEADWRDVEPAIFGTLLERALDPIERHKLGAHYTPRAYVERLVIPTVIEPLREEWAAAQAAGVTLAKSGALKKAIEEIRAFHRKLCRVQILDPACGSGNFLYVTLEHMKRLEGEVLDTLESFGEKQTALEHTGLTVDPHQLLGIEANPRAAAITDLVLWIGYLQWHFRTRGEMMPPEPVLRQFHNIENHDAVLAYDGTEPVTDGESHIVTRWDGRTYAKHPVTDEEVPDEEARVEVVRYISPRRAEWPGADFIIGNPPYIGARRIRLALGDEYVMTLRSVYEDVPETCDYVMYWWHKAAREIERGRTRRFGFITTNSIVQSYSRGLIERHLREEQGVRIILAIPDHPWVEASDGAAVRVAMTVVTSQQDYTGRAILARVIDEEGEKVTLEQERVAFINESLKSVPETQNIESLRANKDICFQGVVPSGEGFKLDPHELSKLGYSEEALPPVIRKYIIGRDLVQRHRPKYIIDFSGLSEEEARARWPELYQHILDRVKQEREAKTGTGRTKDADEYARNWWLFAKTRPVMRRALAGLRRFIVTPYTAKHRPFIFVDGDTLPDAMAYAIASDDAYILGILSSRAHVQWALSAGGRLGVGNDPRYTSQVTFMPFPFPESDEVQKTRIRELGEALDAHRKRQQAQYPNLTITGMYNVLEKLRANEPLTNEDKKIHDQGLISVLRQIHEDLDAAVFDAYRWPTTLSDDDVVQHVAALNAQRAREEANGLVRWIRPEWQHPEVASQQGLGLSEGTATRTSDTRGLGRIPWPKTLAEQAKAVRQALNAQRGALTAEQIAERFVRGKPERIEELLETLVSLGQAREVGDGKFTA
jgi:hypothetical protein